MERGLVVGKFYPFHAGHRYLIETACGRVGDENLTVMVIHRPDENPHGALRQEWVQKAFPNTTVMLVDDIGKDDDSKAWADYTIELLGQAPDVVFTSEDYGTTWAEELRCEHHLVDKARKTFPVSGTIVRKDPFKQWQFLDENVRAHYVKHICVIGAESTGTTTLTRALAEHYQTTWVPEFGRVYTEGKLAGNAISAEWATQEFAFIAEVQNMMEDQYARYANKYLFCDTDSFATAVWHERYMEFWATELEELFNHRNYDLYIVTEPDIPFVQDGMRDGQHIRKKMHRRFIELLGLYGKPFVTVHGSVEQRLSQSIEALEKC